MDLNDGEGQLYNHQNQKSLIRQNYEHYIEDCRNYYHSFLADIPNSSLVCIERHQFLFYKDEETNSLHACIWYQTCRVHHAFC
jgi:hypothetical protein